MSSEEADHQRSFAEKVDRGQLHVILIEQGEVWSAVPNFQHALFNAGSFELGRGSMHLLDDFARRVIRSGSGFECLLEFAQPILKG